MAFDKYLYRLPIYAVTVLEEIATHYEIDEVNINRLKLDHMGPNQIVFKASGIVDCTLQYGSDSDVANDSGMRLDDHYPLTCEFVADISTPLELKVRKLHVIIVLSTNKFRN